jgi:peptidoglycan-associated lipoprotein
MKIKFLYPLVLALFIGLVFQSCKSSKPGIAAAEKAYKTEKYFTAADLYKQAIPNARKKEVKAELTYKVGECYRMMNNHKQAATWYEKAVKAGYDSSFVYFNWANALKSQDRYEDAIDTYKEYQASNPRDSSVQPLIENCNMALEWKKKEVFFDVTNETTLNTKDTEYAPAFYGKGIIFTSNRGQVKNKNFYERSGKNYENIYASTNNGPNKWSKVEPLNKDINTPFNEGVATFDNTTRTLYFTQCNGPKGKDNACKIFETQNEGSTWTEPKEVLIPNPDSALLAHPSIAADGNRIFFVSNMKGGQGGQDIWYSDRQGSSWSAPINAGAKINTSGDELFPFIHPSGTLYFSSNGHPGIGGFDVFVAEWEEGDWAAPMNLKSPTNSSGDDISFIVDEDKQTGYMASNRFGGKGEDDIYSVTAIPLVFTVAGKTTNASNNKTLEKVKVTIVGSDGSSQTAISDAQGKYKFILKKDVNYQLNCQKYRFFGAVDVTSTYNLKESKDITIDFKLAPIPLREIVLKGILYDLAKAELRDESKTILDSLTTTMNNNPTFVIEIASHTDSRADSLYNQDLSQRRAQSVVDYLVSKGIDKDRLVAKGYGEERLINDCKDGVECTEEQHQQNRRTSFAVISEDFVPKEGPKIPAAGAPQPRTGARSLNPRSNIELGAPVPAPGATPATRPAQPGTIAPATRPAQTGTVPASATPTTRPAQTGTVPASATPTNKPAQTGTVPASATPTNKPVQTGTMPASATPTAKPAGQSNIPASATPTAKPAGQSNIPASATPTKKPATQSNIPASATPTKAAPAKTDTSKVKKP